MDAEAGAWPRWRLLTLLAGLAVTALVLLAGLSLAVFYLAFGPAAVSEGPPAVFGADTTTPARGEGFRDQVASAPMMRVPGEAARPTTPSAALSLDLPVPAAGSIGPAGVAVGFPRTPAGAVGQLAAIEVRVLEAMSVPVTHAVHAGWVLPGGPSVETWELTGNVQAFLAAAQQEGNAKDETTLVTAIPAGGLVKGVDGPDWTLACVLLEVRASIIADARIGYGHCARMQWAAGRWMIAPGPAPAPAPSTWPTSDLAIRAGWQAWREEPRP